MTMPPNALPVFVGVLVAFIAAGVAGGVVWAARKRAKLSRADCARIAKAWSRVEGLRDPTRRVIEADKVFDMLLTAWGRKGTFVQKFKGFEARFSNAEDLWRAHKLRNRLAHEAGADPSAAEAGRAVAAFQRGLQQHVDL
jgi:hypothetical protein